MRKNIDLNLLLHCAVTIVWVVLAAFLINRADWSEIKPNEVGDFLAGVAAPPAFYWLIVGFFMQRAELKLQREELAQAREQFKRQADALEENNMVSQEALRLSEINLVHSELRETIKTIPEHMKPVTQYLASIGVLRSRNHAQDIVFMGNGIQTLPQDRLIADIYTAVSKWPEEEHGRLRDCLELSNARFFEFSSDVVQLRNWFNAKNSEAFESGASFFYQECKRLKLIELLYALNRMMEPQEDWHLHSGGDR